MIPWFDAHVHLDRYSAAERDALLARAREAGAQLLAVAVDVESSRLALRLAATCREVFGAAIGVHPTCSGTFSPPELEALANNPNALAIGECGFDDAEEDWPAQRAAFAVQCELARRLAKPLVLHIDGARAWDELLARERRLDGVTVVRHYFTGDAGQAAWHESRGHYLSFGNPLRRMPKLREIARTYPAELLLVETDTYPLLNRSTEPAHVVQVAETLALTRDWTFEQARVQLAGNTRRAFKVAKS